MPDEMVTIEGELCYTIKGAMAYIASRPDPNTGKYRTISASGMLHHIYKTKQLLPTNKVGKTLLFSRAALDAFIAQRGQAGHRRTPKEEPVRPTRSRRKKVGRGD